MTIQELSVILAVAGLASLIGRTLAGYSLAGCLITYVLACLGAVAGWYVQINWLHLPDRLVTLPLISDPQRISIIGAFIGALLLAFFGSLLSRRVPRPRSRQRRY